MTIIILLAALVLSGIVGTCVELRRDGFRPVRTDWTRVAERDRSRSVQSTRLYP